MEPCVSRRPGLPILLLLLALAGCRAATPPPRGQPAAAPPAPVAGESLAAVLWLQTAAEAEQLDRSTFAAAERALVAALADPGRSALDQGEAAAALPPAVIADVDETLLDNSPYEARGLLEGRGFDPATWHEWVERAEAAPRPGALEFARRAAALGVEVFYVTNRDARQEAATRRNLLEAGFPLHPELDTVLVEGERPEWGRDKESRRAAVARTHRVLLLLGDDLNDFVSGAFATPEARRELASRHARRFGHDWFLFANPVYGSWSRALEGNERGLAPEEARRRRLEHLRAWQ